jgi:hypothetical protein
MFILTDQGRVDTKNMARAYRIVGGDMPRLHEVRLHAVAQLRSEYADRFLQQAGHHTSRVGIDFVDLVLAKPKKAT